MSLEQTDLTIEVLTRHVHEAYDRDEPATLVVNGWPYAHVLSLEPVCFERYGFFRNRGPHLVGQYVVRSLLQSTDDEPGTGRKVVAVIEANQDMYGFSAWPEQLENLARKVGAPAMNFFPVEPAY